MDPDSPLPSVARALLRILRAGVVIYLGVVGLVWVFQRRLQYFPDPTDPPLPAEAAAAGLTEVTLRAEDGVALRAWHWPGDGHGTILYLHGNGGHRGHRMFWLADLHRLGMAVFILDYRGYGGSDGHPDEAGLYRDGEAAWRWLEDRGAGPIILYGESMGAGVAVEVARRHAPAALVLQSAFSSAVDVGRHHYPWLPVGILLKDRYENARKIESIETPVLVVHGERDRIVPVASGRALYEAAAGAKEWYLVPRAGHNDLVPIAGSEYRERLAAFIAKHVGR